MGPSPKILYGRNDAAEILSISARTLDRLIAAGEIKAIRKGSRIMIHCNELERWARKDDPRPIRRERAEVSVHRGEQLELTR
jgi:excisionase family DNA binding protein